MGQIKKSHITMLISITLLLNIIKRLTFFYLPLFEARVEILKKNHWLFDRFEDTTFSFRG